MAAYEVPENRWPYKLAPTLTGKAQQAYAVRSNGRFSILGPVVGVKGRTWTTLTPCSLDFVLRVLVLSLVPRPHLQKEEKGLVNLSWFLGARRSAN